MNQDLALDKLFPEFSLPDHMGAGRSLADLAQDLPLVLAFVRGWWCPKEQIRVRRLVEMQDEIQREYGRIAVVTVDEPYANGAFRAGLGAAFPFLSDEDRRLAVDLDLLEVTDERHRPYLPFTFVLDSTLRVRGIWCGFWYWGNPTADELRLALRDIARAEQPTFDPQRVWRSSGSAPAEAGIEADAVWIREDSEGREIWRGAYRGDVPDVGAELGRSAVDGRPWVVHEIDRATGRVAIHVRRSGTPGRNRLVGHHITAPRSVR